MISNVKLSSYFRSGLLETIGDNLLYLSQYFLGVTKLHVFRKKNIRYFWRCYKDAAMW
jgi:hypothetical protein